MCYVLHMPTTNHEGGTTMDAPQTNGGRLLKRGDTYDIECWRTTHRLRVGQQLLASLGYTPTYAAHSDKCIRSPKNRTNRVSGFNYMCDDQACPMRHNPAPTWPAECTGEVFDKAYAMACAVQDGRRSATQRAINAQRQAEYDPRDQAEAFVGLGEVDGGGY